MLRLRVLGVRVDDQPNNWIGTAIIPVEWMQQKGQKEPSVHYLSVDFAIFCHPLNYYFSAMSYHDLVLDDCGLKGPHTIK